MNKITFKNGESGGTPINATNLNQMQTNIENGISTAVERNILTAKLITDNQTMTTTESQIYFNSHSKIGTKLSFSNNAIKIGAGVSQILVSGVISVYWNSVITNDAVLKIQKNTSEVIRINGSKIAEKAGASIVCPPVLVSVAENDIIRMNFIAIANTIIQSGRTCMTVEVVDG